MGDLEYCDEFGTCWGTPIVVSHDPAPVYDYGGEYGIPVTDAQLAADYEALVASGKAGGFDIGTPTSINAPNLAAALKSGAVVLSKLNPSGAKICPSGYARPDGVCVSVTGALPRGSAPWVAGVSNQTLMIAGVVLFGVLMLGKKR